jgi:hypothetical protein
MPDSTADTEQHIRKVQARLAVVIHELRVRGEQHDASKLEEPEKSGFDVLSAQLSTLVYGSDEYKAALEAGKPTVAHHYAHNSHHPESTRAREEEWRAVAGFEGYYEVSNFGEVRSIDRLVPRDGPTGNMTRKGQLRKPHITPKGYLRVQLTKDGEAHNYQVHRLVALAFIPNPDNKPEVNHRNGNKRDNYVGNLEWSTGSENQTHAYQMGLKKPIVKYVVHCEELDITTFGTEKMEHELRARGYDKAHSAAVWACVAGDSRSHLGLTFTSCNIEDYKPESDVRFFSLLDLVECVCDWKAASERTKQGSIAASLVHNKERFGIDDQLYAILVNTVRELGW